MRYKNKYKLRLSSENNLCWTPSDYNLMSRSESFTLAGLISTVLYNRCARFNHMEGLFIFARIDRTMGCVLHYNNTEIINGYEVRDWLQDNVHKSWVYEANNFIVDDKKALPELRGRIGWDSAKWRWKTDSWNKADIKDYEEYKHELKIFKMQQESERKLKRKLVSYIKANITKLKDEYIEKFNKTFMIYMYDDKKGYYNVRSAYHTLNKWLKMPERLKEQLDVAED